MSSQRKKKSVPNQDLNHLSGLEKAILGLAGELEAASEKWRERQGYTGRSSHKPEFFHHLAAEMINAGWWNRRQGNQLLEKWDVLGMIRETESVLTAFSKDKTLHPQTAEAIRRIRQDVEVGPLVAVVC